MDARLNSGQAGLSGLRLAWIAAIAVPRAYQTANGHNLSLWLARMKREPEKLTEDQIEALADVGLTSHNRPSLAAG